MAVCTACGQDPGDGRFCARCGHALRADADPVTDTAERPASESLGRRRQPPPPPPHPGAPPSNARFPMYADEVVGRPGPPAGVPGQGGPPPSAPYAPVPPPMSGPASPPMSPPVPPRTRRHGFVPIAIAGVCALLLLVLVAVWLVFRPVSGDGKDVDQSGSAAGSQGTDDPGSSDDGATAGDPADLTAQAQVDVPAVAPPNQDVNGRAVTYVASNMLDGDAQTAWRMPGDGSTAEITIDLGGPTTVTEVGLVNGYAKIDRDTAGREVRWYPRNRRILEVSWTFDDGTTVMQSLEETARLQSIEVPEVDTTTITLRLLEVSPPQAGPQGRNYTAISDLALVGSPAP